MQENRDEAAHCSNEVPDPPPSEVDRVSPTIAVVAAASGGMA
jgi:hypothetical protein